MSRLAGPKLVVLLVLVFAVGAMAISCAPAEEVEEPEEPEEPAEPDEPEEPEEPDEIEELVVVKGSDAQTMDPQMHSHRATGGIHVNIFDALVVNEPSLEPELATDWEAIDDTTWQFNLREDVYWHDGEPFTAEDVKFTMEERVIGHPDSAYAATWEARIDEVEIVDDYTVNFHLNYVYPDLPSALSSYARLIVPKHYIEEHGDDHFAENPIGTGPYKFVEWSRDSHIMLEANENYWGEVPDFKEAIFRIVPEPSTRLAEAETGEAHIVAAISPADRDRLEASEYSRPVRAPIGRILQWEMQTHPDSETGDVRVRHAIDYAIDNETLVDQVADGFGTPVRTFVTGDMRVGADTHYDDYRFDQDRAVELLEEAGYGPGELEIRVNACRGRYPMDAEVGEVVGLSMLPDVGIETELEILEWDAHGERARSPGSLKHMAMTGSGVSGDDPAGRLLSRFQRQWQSDEEGGFMNYADNPNTQWEEFEDLLIRVTQTPEGLDWEVREELVMRALEIEDEDMPVVYMYRIDTMWAVNENVNYEPTLNEYYYLDRASPR